METLVPAMVPAREPEAAALVAPAAPAGAGPRVALTPGQRWLLEQLARGCTNAEMAALLGRSEKTVRNRLTALYARLGVRNRAGAVGVWGLRAGGPHSG